MMNEFGKVIENANLTNYNTYKINTTCDYLIFPNNIDSLINLLKYLKENHIKYLILGGGSNVILSDNIFNGVIIKLDNLNKVEIKDNIVYVGSGVMLNKLANDLVNSNISGLEWATGIPGTIGGSVYGNAGAYNSSMFDFINYVDCLDENYNMVRLNKSDIKYEYRNTAFKETKKYIILGVSLTLSIGDKEKSQAVILDRLQRRLSSQPLEYPSAGSVFRNPSKELYAGKLIEDVNLKGYNINDAYIADKHANFIINKGHAKGKDIVDLINYTKRKVKDEYNVDLHLEQEIINW